MTKSAPGAVSDRVLIVEMGNIARRQTISDCYRLSYAGKGRFADVMGVHVATLDKYLAGTKVPSEIAGRAAIFAAIYFGVSLRMPRVTDLSTTTKLRD